MVATTHAMAFSVFTRNTPFVIAFAIFVSATQTTWFAMIPLALASTSPLGSILAALGVSSLLSLGNYAIAGSFFEPSRVDFDELGAL
jgi:hypothetical protein